MPSNSTRLSVLLATAVVMALIANVALFFRMSARLDNVESSLVARSAPLQFTTPVPDGAAERYSSASINPYNTKDIGAARLSPEQLVARLSQRNGGDSGRITADMNLLMQQEPSLPVVESQQTQWLESAMGQLPVGGPRASNVQSSCRGRRCVISANFADAGEAQDWAGNYLLAAGGKMLQQSRAIVLPAPNGSAKLLLYFY